MKCVISAAADPEEDLYSSPRVQEGEGSETCVCVFVCVCVCVCVCVFTEKDIC